MSPHTEFGQMEFDTPGAIPWPFPGSEFINWPEQDDDMPDMMASLAVPSKQANLIPPAHPHRDPGLTEDNITRLQMINRSRHKEGRSLTPEMLRYTTSLTARPMSSSDPDVSSFSDVSDTPGLSKEGSISSGSSSHGASYGPPSPRDDFGPPPSFPRARDAGDKWDPNLYPQDFTVLRVDDDYQVESTGSPGWSTTSAWSPSSGVAPPVPGKRSRRIEDPDKVAKVRKMGACTRCRIGKYQCCQDNPCTHCKKYTSRFAVDACSRQKPSDIRFNGGDIWAQGHVPNRTRQTWQDVINVQVIFPWTNPVSHGAPLDLVVQTSPCSNGGVGLFLYHDAIPTQYDLEQWVESHMLYESNDSVPSFRSAIEDFLMTYSRRLRGAKRIDLVNKVHSMLCMYRIWKSDRLWVMVPKVEGLRPLPKTVHTELKNIAKGYLVSLERHILKEFDKAMSQPLPAKCKDPDLPLWACLWQTIFIYGEMRGIVQHQAGRQTAHRLFITLMVMMATNFRNQSPIVFFREEYSSFFHLCGDDVEVFERFRAVYTLRDSFHRMMKERNDTEAALFTELVVLPEQDLDRRRKRSKGSSR